MSGTPPTVEHLERSREVLIRYLRTKLEEADWHGVQDAASDIREIEAMLRVLGRKEPGRG